MNTPPDRQNTRPTGSTGWDGPVPAAIGASGAAPAQAQAQPASPSQPQPQRDPSDRLDEWLAQSFPASDPLPGPGCLG